MEHPGSAITWRRCMAKRFISLLVICGTMSTGCRKWLVIFKKVLVQSVSTSIQIVLIHIVDRLQKKHIVVFDWWINAICIDSVLLASINFSCKTYKYFSLHSNVFHKYRSFFFCLLLNFNISSTAKEEKMRLCNVENKMILVQAGI